MISLRVTLLSAALSALFFCAPSTAWAAEQAPRGGASIFQTVVMFAAVCALAAMTLKLGARRWQPAADGPLKVVARVPIEPRRSVIVLQIGARAVVVGSSEAGLQPLAELGAEEIGDFLTATNVSRETSAGGAA